MTEGGREPGDDPTGAQVELLLDYLRETLGLDFTGYKRPSLTRRIRKRMQELSIDQIADYRDYLEVHPAEHRPLVDTILINVTGFFRDPAAWAFLAEEVVPAIVAAKDPDDQIRVWSAGCASGEEPYSLAMTFAECLGLEAFKSRVKVFATDIDDHALAEGRRGVYRAKQLESVSEELRAKYFEPVAAGFQFRSDCRRSVIFGRHDVTLDAPISRLDLLVCRNTLMYFVNETQRRVLRRFHYSLRDHGVLFLGKAETIFAHSSLFEPLAAQHRIFIRRPGASDRDGSLLPPVGAAGLLQLQDLAMTALPVAQLLIDLDGVLVDANAKARAMFDIGRDDAGRPFRLLEVSHRPAELRSQIELAYAELRPVVLHGVTRTLADGQAQFLDVTIAPLCDASGRALGVSISFADVSELGRLKTQLERSAQELHFANEALRTANEELETSNEELQSTNEELETTNEELQSTNEELETMNEELQSTNEELETMNEELVNQAMEIDRSGRFLAAVLDSLVVGVAVLDERLDVVSWNRAAEELFGVRRDEVHLRSFLALDIGLPVGEIGPLLHDQIEGRAGEPSELTLDGIDRRGRAMRCRVTVRSLTGRTELGRDVVVLIDPISVVD